MGMTRDENLKGRWDGLQKKLSNQFADGESMDLDAIIYVIGVQELGGSLIENSKKIIK